eukprot:CAMPEP_0116045864 /NCGR_PEP_ID=MMETSP0321-20121206/27886_1 /TAXON_ID=163516 /ORGANISM="Leptocylindrus danicus var. danicus, Strain B650" /LENGTH=894 /DNA_ID=CAMNT_0003527307 /DNA_START=24 /DNA_END=2708 /DNA_ORIENTATION=+
MIPSLGAHLGGQPPHGGGQVLLCASCDRCRQRKTKCDGGRPCSNCVSKYMKKNKLNSIQGVDITLFDCVYSPAKRRGPVPGNSQVRKREAATNKQVVNANNAQLTCTAALDPYYVQTGQALGAQNPNGIDAYTAAGGYQTNPMGGGANGNAAAGLSDSALYAATSQQLNYSGLGGAMNVNGGAYSNGTDVNAAGMPQSSQYVNVYLDGGSSQYVNVYLDGGASNSGATTAGSLTDSNNLYKAHLLEQERQQLLSLQQTARATATAGSTATSALNYFPHGTGTDSLSSSQQQQQHLQSMSSASSSMQTTMPINVQAPPEKRVQRQHSPQAAHQLQQARPGGSTGMGMVRGQHSTVANSELLQHSNVEGNLLRSYYNSSINELFGFPPIPTDDEYCAKLSHAITPNMLPSFDSAALRAARFSEVALGALVNNQMALALELSNATVMSLRECVEEPVHPNCMFELARAYLLHGFFRSLRGDMVRYFKYRRVCLTHLTQLDNLPETHVLLAAISLHDAWAYMMHNASEDNLPQIDGSIPPLTQIDAPNVNTTNTRAMSQPSKIVRDPDNQMWIQGPPPIFINNEAPTLSRAIDALACAIRSCCDQANQRFESMASEMQGGGGGEAGNNNEPMPVLSATSRAVMANEKELCSRNMVVSASTLLQQELNKKKSNSFKGLTLIISAMDVFLEGGEEEEGGGNGFSESQIQGLASVCNAVIESPSVLYHGGPTYHMISNAAIMICHLLNGMHMKRKAGGGLSEMEEAMFSEFFDTFTAIRKLLNNHRRKVPVKLRCHGIPRANVNAGPEEPFVDLGQTLMCSCRGCQGFALMGCSPCVAAERAQAAALQNEISSPDDAATCPTGEVEEDPQGEFGSELVELGSEFDMDDDALLDVLSRIIAG